MIDKLLADLIKNYGFELYPYIELLAIECHQGYPAVLVIEERDLNEDSLNTLRDSDLIKYEKRGGQYLITLRDGDRYLSEPPVQRTPYKAKREEYIPKELEELAVLFGYPDDWVPKIGKYRKNYSVLTNLYSKPIIKEVAKYANNKKLEYDLNLFLTRWIFRSLKHNMENPQKKEDLDRCSTYDPQVFPEDDLWNSQ